MSPSRPLAFPVLFGLFLLLAVALPAFPQAIAPHTDLDNLRTATSLDRKGMSPFHLRVAFELYGLDGKKQQAGTVDEWWTSPTQHRTVIATASRPHGFPPFSRESFLVHALLDGILHPVPSFAGVPHLVVNSISRKVSGARFSCLVVSNPIVVDVHPQPTADAAFCVPPDTYNLRLMTESGFITLSRNHSAKFLNTQLALDTVLSYNGLHAVSGHIETLATFDPAQAPSIPAADEDNRFDAEYAAASIRSASSAADAAATSSSSNLAISNNGSASPVHIDGALLVGRITKKVRPDYPYNAQILHLGGTVLIHGIITTTGAVRDPIVIATPGGDPTLATAALDAIRQWTYEPYTVDGRAIEVESTFTLNFDASPN